MQRIRYLMAAGCAITITSLISVAQPAFAYDTHDQGAVVVVELYVYAQPGSTATPAGTTTVQPGEVVDGMAAIHKAIAIIGETTAETAAGAVVATAATKTTAPTMSASFTGAIDATSLNQASTAGQKAHTKKKTATETS